MSSRKISQLPAAAAVTSDDLVAIVDDPLGTPETKKATVAQLTTTVAGSTLIAPRLLPAAGSATQVLVKLSAANYDVGWGPQSHVILPVTTAQRNALSPYTGLAVYNTDVNRVQIFNGSTWDDIGETYFLALTTAQRNALTPFVGQAIFNTDTNELQIWSGTAWITTGVPPLPSMAVLTDVDLSGLNDGDVLFYNNSTGFWEPAPIVVDDPFPVVFMLMGA